MDDVAAEVKRDAEELKARLQNLKSAREHSKQVNAAEVPPLPKMGGMKLVRNPRPAKKTPNSLPILTFTGHIKTKKGMSGGAMFQKIKREVREKSHFGNHSKLAVPTHKLSERASKVLVAPPSIIYDRLNPRYDFPAPSPPPPPPSSTTRAKPELKKPYVFNNAKKHPGDHQAAESAGLPTPPKINVNHSPVISSSQSRTTSLLKETIPGTSGRRPKMAPLRRPSNIITRPNPADPFMPAKRRRLS